MQDIYTKIVNEGLNKDTLERMLNEAPYSTKPEEDRVNALATYLYFIQSFDELNCALWSFKDKDEDGTDYMINFVYATDYPLVENLTGLKYLWVDIYENGDLVASSLEDVLYKTFLFSSETTPCSYYKSMIVLYKRGELKEISFKDL